MQPLVEVIAYVANTVKTNSMQASLCEEWGILSNWFLSEILSSEYKSCYLNCISVWNDSLIVVLKSRRKVFW